MTQRSALESWKVREIVLLHGHVTEDCSANLDNLRCILYNKEMKEAQICRFRFRANNLLQLKFASSKEAKTCKFGTPIFYPIPLQVSQKIAGKTI